MDAKRENHIELSVKCAWCMETHFLSKMFVNEQKVVCFFFALRAEVEKTILEIETH